MSLRGLRVLITSGPTREHLDPIRFLTNASSGRMGFALAAEARRRGAKVVVVSGPVTAAPPRGVRVVDVESALEMRAAALAHAARADVVIGAAAVGDWRFKTIARRKIKRSRSASSVRLTLVPNPDIIREVGRSRRRPRLVAGFALETGALESAARRKLVEKNLDLVVANGAGTLASERSRAALVGRGWTQRLPALGKAELAKRIFNALEKLLEQK